ncbi:MAG: hypothetical protein KDB03_06430 [Planctomycetales bacterium]|nr:hypothetical protein [Planctomycetales bacterium]
MNANELLLTIRRLRPNYCESELLRLALLVSFQLPHTPVSDDQDLDRLCQEVSWQLSAACDQHAAVAEEIDQLAAESATEYQAEHLWTLVRALKVQSQLLNFYLGPDELTV